MAWDYNLGREVSYEQSAEWAKIGPLAVPEWMADVFARMSGEEQRMWQRLDPRRRDQYARMIAKALVAGMKSGRLEVNSELGGDAPAPREEDLPLMERMVARGFRALAPEFHPDTGGSSKRFDELKRAKVQLDAILREVREVLGD